MTQPGPLHCARDAIPFDGSGIEAGQACRGPGAIEAAHGNGLAIKLFNGQACAARAIGQVRCAVHTVKIPYGGVVGVGQRAGVVGGFTGEQPGGAEQLAAAAWPASETAGQSESACDEDFADIAAEAMAAPKMIEAYGCKRIDLDRSRSDRDTTALKSRGYWARKQVHAGLPLCQAKNHEAEVHFERVLLCRRKFCRNADQCCRGMFAADNHYC